MGHWDWLFFGLSLLFAVINSITCIDAYRRIRRVRAARQRELEMMSEGE